MLLVLNNVPVACTTIDTVYSAICIEVVSFCSVRAGCTWVYMRERVFGSQSIRALNADSAAAFLERVYTHVCSHTPAG